MSQRPVLVSILVPAYNAARYLPELCRSIQAQTYPHYEVLIANDGSTDNTVVRSGSIPPGPAVPAPGLGRRTAG